MGDPLAAEQLAAPPLAHPISRDVQVEIGGDAASTDGTEPSHKHTRADESCTRGYETWLISEAAARNPGIQTFGLSWGVPAWVGNGSYYRCVPSAAPTRVAPHSSGCPHPVRPLHAAPTTSRTRFRGWSVCGV